MAKEVIWKVELDIVAEQTIEIPSGATFLSAREQNDHVCAWFICDPDKPKEPRTIAMVGTGHEVPTDGDSMGDEPFSVYLGTAIIFGGNLVWHVFEVVK